MSNHRHQSQKKGSAFVGVSLACAACALFAASGTIVRLGTASGGNAAAIMIIQAFVTFVIAAAVSGGRLGLEKAQMKGIFALGIAAGSGALCLVEGYARLGIAPVAALFALYPGVVGIGLWILEKRRPTPLWLCTLILALIGVAFAVGGQERRERPLWEYGFPIAATLAIAANDIIAQRVVTRSPVAHTVAWVNLVTMGLALAAYNQSVIDNFGVQASVAAGIMLGVCLYLALQLKLMSVARVGAQSVSLVAAGQPAIAAAIAAVVLRERLSFAQTFGIGLVAFALGMTVQRAVKTNDASAS